MSTTEYVSQLYKYLKWLCEKASKKILLLIDLCKCDDNDHGTCRFSKVVTIQNLQVVVAFTSVSGKFINNEYVYSSMLYEPGVEHVNFHGFNG